MSLQISPQQYLNLDRSAEHRSEYFDGEMFPLACGGLAHSQIIVNTAGAVGPPLRGTQCQAMLCNMRTRIGSAERYAYPDLVVICGKPDFVDYRQDVLLNPTVIVEVLSPSTADFDRGFKFVAYTAIPSLRQYVLIASDRASIEVFTRQPDGVWPQGPKAIRLEDSIELESIGCRLALADVYERVEFPAAEASA